MESLIVIFVTLILFLAMILLLATKPKFSGKLASAYFLIVGIGGLLFYGYGLAFTESCIPVAIIKALINTCKMYVGAIDWGSISGTKLMESEWAKALFWGIHLLAFYATASAAIAAVGAEALRKLRLWLARWGHLNLIYGVNPNTLELGRLLAAQKGGMVVFVDGKAADASADTIAKTGCVLRSDSNALQADEKFAKAVGAHRKNRKISLYAMESDATSCYQYARRFLQTMESLGVPGENINLVIRGQEHAAAIGLQMFAQRYGYGAVTVVQEPALAARVLMQQYPPCSTIHFDENGLATENFEALVIGFGQVGQTVLRQLVMNGQFEGSRFRAAVFSPDCNGVKGHFSRTFPQVLKQYHIEFHACDARSEEMYDYLDAQGRHLKYVAICTGSDHINQEIAENLTEFFQAMGLNIPVYLCTHQGVKAVDADGSTLQNHTLYQPQVLSSDTLDKMAMLVNHHYMGDPDRPPVQTWRSCDYFSRMSCRATSDFIPAMVQIAGKTKEQVLAGDWDLTPAQLENMSKTEHLRWCAFHFAMGYSPMTEAEFASRASRYLQQKEAGEKPLRITKNTQARAHACLVSWEELEVLSEKENAITGGNRDYQYEDTKNILVVPKLLKAAE